ncbi:hypothetical protein FQN60_004378 [Etheostoma spectabile]|uniref:Uncharacterized protein n=1 Tax=Etheostoma spectabile TaxID=54343 RepID=A0A5J5CX21_9PERO|nr:hypothetical protein FQN60_004378 [Etheostoma spectabile]
MAATSAVSISPPAHQGPIAGSLHTNSRGPTCEQQAPGLHGISQDPGASFHPQPPVFVRPFFYVHAPPPPQPPPPPPFLHYQWPMPFPYNPFAAFPGMGYGMVMPPFPPHPYMNAPAHFLHHPHPHVQPVDRRFLHSPVYAPSAPYQNPNRTHRSHQSHTGNVRETVNCEVQTEPIQIGRYGERSPLIDSDSGRATGSNSPSASSTRLQKRGSAEVRNNTLSSSASLTSAGSPDSIVPVCSSFQQEVVKERHVSVPDILMSWRSGTPQARILKLADNLPQNDDQLPSYETEKGHQKSFYQSPTQTKNGPVVADSADDDAERNLNSKNGATLYQILKLSKAHGEWKAEGRRENEPVGLNGSQKRSLPYTDKLLHSHKKSRPLPDNEQEDETNPQRPERVPDQTEIIPYQMYSCQTARKMNESVWSVESLPPFIATKEWLLQNGMLEPEVTDPVLMSKTPPQNHHQLSSYTTEEDNDRSFYQSPTRTKNGPIVADGAYDNTEGSLCSVDISTLYTIFKLRDDHEERNAESQCAVQCSLPSTDELLHSQNESRKLPDNEQEDGDKSNPHADPAEILPYQMSFNSSQMRTIESLWSVKSLPSYIPTKDSLLQNSMFVPKVTDYVPVSKTLPQNDHQLPSYATEDHEKSYQCLTQTKNGPVVADGPNDNAKGNLHSEDSTASFIILKLRQAHEEQSPQSRREIESVEFTGSEERDELLQSQNESHKLPNNEQEDEETNPHGDTTEIIPYQMSLNVSQMERKMNESVWSVESLPPLIPEDWLLQNGMYEPKVTGSVPVSKTPPQNDHLLPCYENEEQMSFYQSTTRKKNGPMVDDSEYANDAESNLSSMDSVILFKIFKLIDGHEGHNAECRRENEPMRLVGSGRRHGLPCADELLHPRKLPDHEQENGNETNPLADITEIIPYQMYSCQTESKMNESVWSVESLPPFIPSKEWLLQNGMLDPEVSDSVPMSKTLSRNDNQLLSHLAEEEHKKSSYQSPTQTENSPLVPDGANDNAKGSLSSKNSPTFFELKEAHEVQKSESRRENEPVGLVDPVRRMLLYTDELPHSRNESQTIPDNEQEDADKTNPHEDTTPYQIKKTTESVCSAESLPLSIPNKDSLLQNGMLEFEVTDSVPMSKTPPQNDHHVPSYEAEEEHVRSVFQRPTRNKNGPVMADAAYTINAEGNLSSMDSATLFKIFKLRKAHEERLAESMKAVRRRVPCTDELRLSQNESQKLPENEQEDGDETNPQADTTEIIPYEVCSSQPARKMNESVKSLAPSMPAKKSSDMDASKTRTLKQGKGIVPLAKGPLASPTPRQSKILFTITEDDTDTNRCRVIGQNGVDVEDEACRNKEVQNQQLCVQTAAQKIADVSPSKTHLVDCGVQCSELLEHNCICTAANRKPTMEIIANLGNRKVDMEGTDADDSLEDYAWF